MVLLDHNGKPQFELQGGEIIFSRVFTKEILSMISKAKTERDKLEIGKAIHAERTAQKNRKPQVVKN